jgi:hypothetical protein
MILQEKAPAVKEVKGFCSRRIHSFNPGRYYEVIDQLFLGIERLSKKLKAQNNQRHQLRKAK